MTALKPADLDAVSEQFEQLKMKVADAAKSVTNAGHDHALGDQAALLNSRDPVEELRKALADKESRRAASQERVEKAKKRVAGATGPKASQPESPIPNYVPIREDLLKRCGLMGTAGADAPEPENYRAFSDWLHSSSVDQSEAGAPSEPIRPTAQEAPTPEPAAPEPAAGGGMSWSRWFTKSQVNTENEERPLEIDRPVTGQEDDRPRRTEKRVPMTNSMLNWTKWLERRGSDAPGKEQDPSASDDEDDRGWGEIFK